MNLNATAAGMLFALLIIGTAGTASGQVTVTRSDGSGVTSVTSGGVARDGVLDPTGAGRIHGRVVASETASGLRNVQIRLTGGGLREGRTAGTDAEGRYEIKDLPAGRFTLTATKPGYVTLSYGQRRPFESGRPIELADKQSLDQVNFALPKGGVIVVRVTDESGDPMSGVRVAAERYRFFQGRRELGSVGAGGSFFGGGTDDRGGSRLYGLPPGEYFVSANGVSPGLFSTMGATDGGRTYVTTYYPGTGSVVQAQKVQVQVGREVEVSFPLVATRFSRISVVVRSSTGGVLRQPSVSLAYVRGDSSGSRSMTSQPDGSYTIADVPPGDYTITVSPPANDRSGTGEYASVPLTVTGEDIKNLAITTGKGVRLRGRFVFDTPAAPELRPAAMRPTISRPVTVFGGSSPPTVNEDWTFEMTGLMGTGLVRLFTQAPGWYLKAVMLNGRDVTDTEFDFTDGRDISDVQLVVTRIRSEIGGTVVDAQGARVAEYVAMVFPEERDRWTVLSRFIAAGRADQQGAFKITGLPPGRYLVAAVDYLETGGERDPELLERLKESATPLVVGDGESKSVTLKLIVN